MIKFKQKIMNKNEIKSKSNYLIEMCTNTGKVRTYNEDNFYMDDFFQKENPNTVYKYFSSKENQLFAVFDGMGGEDYGEESSKIAAETLKLLSESIKKCKDEELQKKINDFVMQANNSICNMLEKRMGIRGGCTVSLINIRNGVLHPFNMGDSRIYHMRHGNLSQITEDDTLAIKKMKANIYTKEEAENSPDRHKLTKFIGMDEQKKGIDIKAENIIQLKEEDIILLCSDGVSDMCSDEEILEILMAEYENNAEAIVQKALENGGIDNSTCMIIKVM